MVTVPIHRGPLSVKDAAAHLSISRAHAWKLVNEKRIRSVRAGHRVLIPMAAIEEFLSR